MEKNQSVKNFYDKFYDWLLLKGPLILLGIAVLLVGLWLIKVFARWMQNRMQRKKISSALKPFFLSMASGCSRMVFRMPGSSFRKIC